MWPLFAEGNVHGLRNDSNTLFRYLSVTAPPIDFHQAYRENWSENIASDAMK